MLTHPEDNTNDILAARIIGHHCFWLKVNGKAVANFDNEADVDSIIELESQLRETQQLLAEYGCLSDPRVFDNLEYAMRNWLD